jgi:hypothetical protein
VPAAAAQLINADVVGAYALDAAIGSVQFVLV